MKPREAETLPAVVLTGGSAGAGLGLFVLGLSTVLAGEMPEKDRKNKYQTTPAATMTGIKINKNFFIHLSENEPALLKLIITESIQQTN
jgi:LDH2 family malate/lactate/ureidoglycolate dehydrogenase